MTNTIDILAPAGNMECLRAAVFAGANAVYLGVQSFNARASAANFSFDELKQAVGFCHARNVKVNVTLNTIIYDSELSDFKDTVIKVARCGVDAVLTQDLAAARIIKEVAPGIALHGSTQMAVHSLRGALLLKDMGFSRAVLAREMTMAQVREVTEKAGIETEVFLHGALCMSLSGQCYASAFLGGRSGNRGRCAGTCRLPMSARGGKDDFHLSLKDLCAMELLNKLKEIGVKCVKIEGRLRTPEYVAATVNSAVSILRGEGYDRRMLSDVFSRSGFTNGFLEGHIDGSMFGVRTREDVKKTKEALPKIRELYRREGQYVPIELDFSMDENGGLLTVFDGERKLSGRVDSEVFDSDSDFEPKIVTALGKLGGTPFYADSIKVSCLDGKAFRLSRLNAARKELVEALLADRETVTGHDIRDFEIPEPVYRKRTPKLIARFENAGQIPYKYMNSFRYIVVPIEAMDDVLGLRYPKERIVLELSRDIFGKEEWIRSQIRKAKGSGFDRFCVSNIGHIPLVKDCRVMSGFTLNVSNSLRAKEFMDLGVDLVTVSPEIDLGKIGEMDSGITTCVWGYGHIPLMLTKSCPLHNVHNCKGCDGKGELTDRMGKKLPVVCHGRVGGYREIFNPVPIYMGDRAGDINTDYISLNFTIEDLRRVEKVVASFIEGSAFDREFTRGLYMKSSI